jgi:hypothetical protein
MDQKRIDLINKISGTLDDLKLQIEALCNEGKSEADKAAVSELEYALGNFEAALCTHYWYA